MGLVSVVVSSSRNCISVHMVAASSTSHGSCMNPIFKPCLDAVLPCVSAAQTLKTNLCLSYSQVVGPHTGWT